MLIRKKDGFISEGDFQKAQRLASQCALFSLKSFGSFGRRKRYYVLRLSRLKRDRDRLLAVSRPGWEEIEEPPFARETIVENAAQTEKWDAHKGLYFHKS